MTTQETTKTTDETSTGTELGSRVTLFNDNVHTFEEVTNQIMVAVGCGEKEAFRFAYMVDRNGSAVVYSGEVDDCVRVSAILQEIGLITEISMCKCGNSRSVTGLNRGSCVDAAIAISTIV